MTTVKESAAEAERPLSPQSFCTPGPVISILVREDIHPRKLAQVTLKLNRTLRLQAAISEREVFKQALCAEFRTAGSLKKAQCWRCNPETGIVGRLSIDDHEAHYEGSTDTEVYCLKLKSICTSSRLHMKSAAVLIIPGLAGHNKSNPFNLRSRPKMRGGQICHDPVETTKNSGSNDNTPAPVTTPSSSSADELSGPATPQFPLTIPPPSTPAVTSTSTPTPTLGQLLSNFPVLFGSFGFQNSTDSNLSATPPTRDNSPLLHNRYSPSTPGNTSPSRNTLSNPFPFLPPQLTTNTSLPLPPPPSPSQSLSPSSPPPHGVLNLFINSQNIANARPPSTSHRHSPTVTSPSQCTSTSVQTSTPTRDFIQLLSSQLNASPSNITNSGRTYCLPGTLPERPVPKDNSSNYVTDQSTHNHIQDNPASNLTSPPSSSIAQLQNTLTFNSASSPLSASLLNFCSWSSGLPMFPLDFTSPAFPQQNTQPQSTWAVPVKSSETSSFESEPKRPRISQPSSPQTTTAPETPQVPHISFQAQPSLCGDINGQLLISVKIIQAVVPYDRIPFADKWRSSMVQYGQAQCAKKGVIEKAVIVSVRMDDERAERLTTWVNVSNFPSLYRASQSLVTWLDYMSNTVPNPPSFDFVGSGMASCVAFVTNW
ncbi:hypothetical protein Pelo_12618 [Pelomyxa schiedti]|nr:hypothetical protein Pelo_12618 [Pelomyxa schiedti]